MAEYGRGVCLKLTGTPWGLSYDEWEALIRQNLREPMYGTARCLRKRAWDVDKRLAELKAQEAKQYAQDFDLAEAITYWDSLHEHCKVHGPVKF